MHFQPLIILALSAGALALPSDNAKRHKNHDSRPSIAPYGDDICTQQLAPSVDFGGSGNGCMKIDYNTNNVGINWGNWPVGMNAFDVFTDDNCQNYAYRTIVNDGLGNDPKGANACYGMAQHGGPWRSVRQNYDH